MMVRPHMTSCFKIYLRTIFEKAFIFTLMWNSWVHHKKFRVVKIIHVGQRQLADYWSSVRIQFPELCGNGVGYLVFCRLSRFSAFVRGTQNENRILSLQGM